MHKKSLALTALSLSILISSMSPAFAITTQEATQAINSARILAPGTQMKINVAKGLATISTFRNDQANEKDKKIEDLLMSKTIFDLEKSDSAKVSIYVYEARDPKQIK